MNKLLLIGSVCLLILTVAPLSAGGCVSAHALGNVGCALEHLKEEKSGQLEFSMGYRHLYSDRHFRGTHEEPERQENRTEVRNNVNSYDLNLRYWKTNNWSFQASLPVIFSTRSSNHSPNNRRMVSSDGIGDLRLMAFKEQIFPKGKRMEGFTWGLGLKLPTGDYKAKDIFYRATGPEERYVDQSIQPGDGGVGILTEVQGFTQLFNSRSFGYVSASYLINPRETNGTPTHRSRANEAITSVPDAYQTRLGWSYVVMPSRDFNIDVSLRHEGVPDSDLIGGSEGFRRPGYASYAELGASFELGPTRFGFSVPVAIARNRVKSVQDRENGIHGDAAFADYLLLANVAYKF